MESGFFDGGNVVLEVGPLDAALLVEVVGCLAQDGRSVEAAEREPQHRSGRGSLHVVHRPERDGLDQKAGKCSAQQHEVTLRDGEREPDGNRKADDRWTHRQGHDLDCDSAESGGVAIRGFDVDPLPAPAESILAVVHSHFEQAGPERESKAVSLSIEFQREAEIFKNRILHALVSAELLIHRATEEHELAIGERASTSVVSSVGSMDGKHLHQLHGRNRLRGALELMLRAEITEQAQEVEVLGLEQRNGRGDELRIEQCVRVGEDEPVPGGGLRALPARVRLPGPIVGAGLNTHKADPIVFGAVSLDDRDCVIGAAIRHDDDLQIGMRGCAESGESEVDDTCLVVRGHDDGDASVGGLGVFIDSDCGQASFRHLNVDENDHPVEHHEQADSHQPDGDDLKDCGSVGHGEGKPWSKRDADPGGYNRFAMRSSPSRDDEISVPRPADPPTDPLYVFSRDQIRALDQAAIHRYKVPGIVLMENAARNIAEEILRMATGDPGVRRILLCCGVGNNGGDGFAVARHLHNAGLDVSLLLAFEPGSDSGRMSEETRTNLEICTSMKIPMTIAAQPDGLDATLQSLSNGSDLIVDALLGTGVESAPRHPLDAIIRWINTEPCGVVSIDVPSGLDCDTGEPFGPDVIRADVTVSLVGLKQGYFELNAQTYLGEVVIEDIGAPVELLDEFGARIDAEPLDRDGDDEGRRRRDNPLSSR